MFLYRTVAVALTLGLLTIAPALAGQRDRDTCQNDDDPKVAVAACTRVINDKRESKGNRADAYYNRGYSYTDLGEYNRAIDDFNQVLKLYPNDADALIERGYAYEQLGKTDEALADYNRAIRIDPKSADAYYNRGYLYTDLEEYDRAIDDFNHVLKIDPKDSDAFIERAYAYTRKGQFDQAMADYDRAIRIKPDDVDSYHQRAVIFAIKGNFKAAIDDYSQQIKLDPKEPDAYLSRGIANLYNNALADAQADFKESLKVDSEFGFAMLWLDIAERRNHLSSRFNELAAHFDTRDWPAPLINLFRGRGTIADAIVEASKAGPLDRTFDLCEAHFYGGQWALFNGDKDAAVEHFRAANGICYKTVVEWYASREELKALGETP